MRDDDDAGRFLPVTTEENASGIGVRRFRALEILRCLQGKREFELSELRAEVELMTGKMKDCEFGPLLNRVRDELRKDGIEYRPAGSPGLFELANDVQAAQRGLRFAQGARRKYRRASAIAACVSEPDKLPPLLKKAHENAEERLAMVEGAARLRTRKRLPGL